MVPLSSYRGVFFQRRVLEGTDAKYYFTENLESPRPGFGLHVEKSQLLKSKSNMHFGTLGTTGEDQGAASEGKGNRPVREGPE